MLQLLWNSNPLHSFTFKKNIFNVITINPASSNSLESDSDPDNFLKVINDTSWYSIYREICTFCWIYEMLYAFIVHQGIPNINKICVESPGGNVRKLIHNIKYAARSMGSLWLHQ